MRRQTGVYAWAGWYRPGTNTLLRRLLDQGSGGWGPAMTDENYERKLAELDDLLNDPNMPFCPSRIWQLMGEISGHAGQMTSMDLESRSIAAE